MPAEKTNTTKEEIAQVIDLHKNGTHSLASKSKPISKTKLKAKPAQAKKVVKKAKVAPKKA